MGLGAERRLPNAIVGTRLLAVSAPPTLNQAGPAPTSWARKRPVNPWLCALVNQLACPGLGTLMAGRKIGLVQLALMLMGFGLVMLFMVMWFGAVFRLASDLTWTEEQYRAAVRAWRLALWVGLGLSGLAWSWALASSIAILRRSKETAGVQPHSQH